MLNELRAENTQLRQELERCRLECAHLRALQPFRRGVVGEQYIANLVSGRVTITNARHDVITPSGHHLEVKIGKLRFPVRGKPTRQWAWRTLLGEDGQKTYDSLILLGPVDERFRRPADGPYVIFDIPLAHVQQLPNPKYLAVTTDRQRGFSRVSAVLYDKYLTNELALKAKYRKA
jgi:hypothetical protein